MRPKNTLPFSAGEKKCITILNMKIAMIVRKMNVRGGVQRHVLYVARELTSRGHDITIYTFFFNPEKCYKELLESCKIVSLDWHPRRRRFGMAYLEELTASRRLALLIDADTQLLNPDHATYRTAYYFKKLVRNIPSVWMMHDIPVRRYSRLREGDWATDTHPIIHAIKKTLGHLIDRYESIRFIRSQDRIAVLDSRDQQWVKKYFHKDAIVVRNGNDADYFAYHPHPSPTKKTLRVLMNGIFFSHRRFEDGIKAAALCQKRGYHITMTVVGDYSSSPAYYQILKNLAAALGMQCDIVFLGRVSENDLLRMYKEHDAFVFPNHLQSWGLAVFEAMSSGLPVIVSRTAGAAEALTHGENALLVNPKAPEEIANALCHLADNPDAYQRFSKNGRAYVEHNVSWKQLADQFEKIFNEVSGISMIDKGARVHQHYDIRV